MTTTHELEELRQEAARRLSIVFHKLVGNIQIPGDLGAESTWTVDKLTAQQYHEGMFTDHDELVLDGDDKTRVQLGVMSVRDQVGATALLAVLTSNPLFLYPLFQPIVEMLDNVPKHGTYSILNAHVWVVALVRALGTANFLAAPIECKDASSNEFVTHMSNWLALLCHAGMYQTLEFLYRADRATLQRAWFTNVQEDFYGGPVGRACCASLNSVDHVRANLTFDVVRRTILDCPASHRPASLRAVEGNIVLAQNGGMAMVTLAHRLDNPMTVERVLNRILEWCPNVMLNVIDTEGFTALARVVQHGGRPGIAAKLVQRGASLLVTLPKDQRFVEARDTPATAPTDFEELCRRQYEREQLLMPRLLVDPDCKPTVRTRRIATYNAAWNERQRQLKAEVGRIVREDLQHRPLDRNNLDAPQIRIHVMSLAVTPREADCTYIMVPEAHGDDKSDDNGSSSGGSSSTVPSVQEHLVPRMTRERHQRQRARIVDGAQLRGRFTGRVYDQYQMEPEENKWLVCPPQINPVVPGMMMTMQIVMQNGAAIDCATPSTVMVTIVGTGDVLDPYLPGFSPVTVVFHTKNYLTYCGLDDPMQDEVDSEAQQITGALGHEMYRLGNHYAMFHPERTASGAACMPFELLGKQGSDALRADLDNKSNTETADPTRHSINSRRFVEVIHWEKEPEPNHLVIAQMNVATAVAPIQVQADNMPPLEDKGQQPASDDQTTHQMNMALKFQTLIFNFTILSRNASDIMLKQHELQEDARLQELDRQERLEQQRKYTTVPEGAVSSAKPELHSMQTDKGVVEFPV